MMVAGYYERATMRVKMLQDAPGSPDGVTVVQYLEGKVHELGEDLAQVFVREGLAEKAEDVTPLPQPTQSLASLAPIDLPLLGTGTKQAAGPDENKAAN